jgi:hypothetical protein
MWARQGRFLEILWSKIFRLYLQNHGPRLKDWPQGKLSEESLPSEKRIKLTPNHVVF